MNYVPENLHFSISTNPSSFYDDLVMYARDPVTGSIDVLTFTVCQMKQGQAIPHESRLPVSPQSLSNMMTALWSRGIRPEGYKGTEGEVKRIEDHLKDTQALNAKLLPVVLDLTETMAALATAHLPTKEQQP